MRSTGRRTMVNKIWWHEIKRKWSCLKSEVPHARLFSEPRWQDHVAVWYLIYRWLIFLSWISIIILSIFEVGSYEPQGNDQKWAIYLTNWDLVLGAAQAFLGCFLVSRRWKSQRESNYQPDNLVFGKLEKVYWFLFVATSSIAIGVTVSYWAAVYDPKIHHVDPLNILLHVCNSILMCLDVCITNIPFRLKHFWWSVAIVTLYAIFSLIYFFAGGLNKDGYDYIYKILDWKVPGRTLLVCLGGFVFVVAVHCLLCLFVKFKDRLHMKINEKRTDTSSRSDNQPPVAIKRIEIIV
ncbi:protein rolling stone isoform X2 [Cephus cinctus]|uniref:Protein rolling stone isoform X2 n=1 Tax=Cephus cinctus TaxID=211228 RepID=A0AAJ7BJX3_CEPCN|nr:protein rolling stone isoform X2 [Cephus cinctus]